MAEQLTFDLPLRVSLSRGDFFVSEANAAALAAIDRWPDWPSGKLLLTGPQGAGKSHLASLWAERAKAMIVSARALPATALDDLAGRNVVLEDADALAGVAEAEAAAFHLHNLVLAEGGQLLVTASAAPARWGIGLPDLASRMQGTQLVAIAPPDEPLLAAVLVKQFADRQIDAPANLVQYLVARIDRSFKAAGEIVAALDALALSEARPVSRKLAARLLGHQPDLL